MTQEQIAGLVLCIIGLHLVAKPKLVWKLTERWKSENSTAPSSAYLTVLRIVGSGAIGLGVLLAAGILK